MGNSNIHSVFRLLEAHARVLWRSRRLDLGGIQLTPLLSPIFRKSWRPVDRYCPRFPILLKYDVFWIHHILQYMIDPQGPLWETSIVDSSGSFHFLPDFDLTR